MGRDINWLVFTDLDGTLLDHHSYSFAPALPALQRLAEAGVPVIINSSKTLAEITDIARRLCLNAPLIAENGSLIAHLSANGQPQQPQILGADYARLCQVMDQLRAEQGYVCQGFHDVDAQTLAQWTGLDVATAAKAKQRQASEPLLWQDSDLALTHFSAALVAQGLQLIRGGRFWHLMGQTDKEQAMQLLVDEYAGQGSRPQVIALGDGPNDRDMLAAADIAVRVLNPLSDPFDWPERPGQRIINTRQPGPVGWNAAINQLLDEQLADNNNPH